MTEREIFLALLDLPDAASRSAQSGDLILTLGAGSVVQLGPIVLEALQPSTSVK